MSRARKRAARWGAGFLIAAAVGGGYAATIGPGVMTSQEQYAKEQRDFAAEACGRSEWSECLKALDRADQADPKGANDPREIALRKAAQAGIGSSQKARPE
jgi:hypothetical protein